jgi:hypothetical protein
MQSAFFVVVVSAKLTKFACASALLKLRKLVLSRFHVWWLSKQQKNL